MHARAQSTDMSIYIRLMTSQVFYFVPFWFVAQLGSEVAGLQLRSGPQNSIFQKKSCGISFKFEIALVLDPIRGPLGEKHEGHGVRTRVYVSSFP